MGVKESYNDWADQYDTNLNKTRDLEAVSLRETLIDMCFDSCLEIGCGTGKNTGWLSEKSNKVLAVDFSEEMLFKAKLKINSPKVVFRQADINNKWTFGTNKFDLIVFSLVLEHIENLDPLFEQLSESIQKDGYVYIGELHPFKQYSGTKAKFETESGTQAVSSYTHNISDYTQVAARYGFAILKVNEYFDDNDRVSIPRILTLLFQK
jgi:SAM-dependent methyltransferase